jgi:hypothetical protein
LVVLVDGGKGMEVSFHTPAWDQGGGFNAHKASVGKKLFCSVPGTVFVTEGLQTQGRGGRKKQGGVWARKRRNKAVCGKKGVLGQRVGDDGIVPKLLAGGVVYKACEFQKRAGATLENNNVTGMERERGVCLQGPQTGLVVHKPQSVVPKKNSARKVAILCPSGVP